MSLKSLFSSATFEDTIRQYCAQHGWNISEVNNRRAVLVFEMESGRSQILYILRYDSTLEFSVPSAVGFRDEDAIPHRLSTLLLRQNASSKIGFWCLETIDGKLTYSCMHNAELGLLDAEYFGNIVRRLTLECDEFEENIAKIASR